jgi:hypothetical protein
MEKVQNPGNSVNSLNIETDMAKLETYIPYISILYSVEIKGVCQFGGDCLQLLSDYETESRLRI